MTFGLSGAALAGVAIGGATLVSGYMQSQSAESAAESQVASSQAGINEQRAQFDAMRKILEPYVSAGTRSIAGLEQYAAAGTPALEQQQAFLGLKGPEAERAAIDRIRSGETFKTLAGQGEEALLQRASATGGLRGGNIQAALAQFRPALLSSLIDKQYGRLGGMTALGQETESNVARLGQASAAGTGAAGQATGANIAALLGQQGAAQAGADIAQGKAYAGIPTAISGGLGIFSGLGGKF